MTGESILFWVLAPLAVAASVAMLFMKKAVHSAILLAWVMITLAIFYIALEAPFLGIVQIVVYTGAVMMLFLFILMLVGVDSSRFTRREDARVYARWQSLPRLDFQLPSSHLSLVQILGDQGIGLAAANQSGNVQGLARYLFSDYVWAFEVISALLITAALGAMVLAHSDEERSRAYLTARYARLRASAENRLLLQQGSLDLACMPEITPLIFQRLLPDGKPSDLCLSQKFSIAAVMFKRRNRMRCEGAPTD
jgi:NADH-quinone oxidoreductase subunit J